ncbi:hypothetical protein [uncultured Thiohalocapsa sp.]|uniref:hypothetical protein n=1 Tax=uncultured Thiohalocapsa sp. TaxID=768990 RepID=UPI0026004AAD|nr:hypothetical protein [uncultured Thiohalocapsa sp.]
MNVISFSLWGDLPIYNVGAVENAKLRRLLYPGWTCRFYVDASVPPQTLSALRAHAADIVEMDAEAGFKRLFWRFLPAQERDVDRFIVRNCVSATLR